MIYTASDKDVNCPLCGLPHVAVHPNEYCICGSGQEIIKELEAKVEKIESENTILRRDYLQLMDVKDFYYRAEHQHGLFKDLKGADKMEAQK